VGADADEPGGISAASGREESVVEEAGMLGEMLGGGPVPSEVGTADFADT
jgi:hypothetical protein